MRSGGPGDQQGTDIRGDGGNRQNNHLMLLECDRPIHAKRRLLKEYVRYYHEDRTHLGLGKDTPGGRVAASAPSSGHNVISLPRLGGLHHRYTVAA